MIYRTKKSTVFYDIFYTSVVIVRSLHLHNIVRRLPSQSVALSVVLLGVESPGWNYFPLYPLQVHTHAQVIHQRFKSFTAEHWPEVMAWLLHEVHTGRCHTSLGSDGSVHTHTHCRTHQQQKQSCCLDTCTDSSWCFVRVESLLVWADRILLPLHLRTACQYDSAHFCDLWPHRCWPFDTKTNWSL